MIILSEKQSSLVKDLQAQEQLCMKKYEFASTQARDPELKKLFQNIHADEKEHYDSLTQLLQGNCPNTQPVPTNKEQYNPTPTYFGSFNQEDKEFDQFLCTDSITTEKYVSSAYNNDLFQFEFPEVRQLMNHIQTEEQNHAEMIYKYKTVNNMQ